MPRTAASRKTKSAPSAAVTITLPALAKGEIYAGVLLKDGQPSHHLVLLPGETTAAWKSAIAWAKDQGGELPTRKEQALLLANAADQFKRDWYWSSEEYAGSAYFAWFQFFGTGDQSYDHKSGRYRARVVRRVAI